MPFILSESLINSSHDQPGFFWAKLISEKLSRSKTSISKQKTNTPVMFINTYITSFYVFSVNWWKTSNMLKALDMNCQVKNLSIYPKDISALACTGPVPLIYWLRPAFAVTSRPMEVVNKTVIFNVAPDNVGITLVKSTTLADLKGKDIPNYNILKLISFS